MSSVSPVRCPYCVFEAPEYSSWLQHLGAVHINHPNFHVRCGIGGCSITYRKYSSLKSHIYRQHRALFGLQVKDTIPSTTEEPAPHCSINGDGSQSQVALPSPRTSAENRKHSEGLLLLKLREVKRVTQTALDDVVSGYQVIFDQALQEVKSQFQQSLVEDGVNDDIVAKALSSSDTPKPFAGLETAYLQRKFYQQELGMLEPTEVVLSQDSYRTRFSGERTHKVRRHKSFQYIPITQTLSLLLRDPSVVTALESPRVRREGVLVDVSDGTLIKDHPVLQQHPDALQLLGYYDEVEVCNPLGANTKVHKMGVVFFTIANLHPKYRSMLKAINLVAIANVTLIEEFGIDKILQPMVDELNLLATTGVEIASRSTPQLIHCALVAFLADNLASHLVGGFKLSMSFAFRICRSCMATKASSCNHFLEEAFELRTSEKHAEHCLKVSSGSLASHYSTTYGVCRRPVLSSVEGFSVVGGLPHDVMHDLLEGILPYEIKLLLKYLISSNFLTLEQFNDRLQNFEYGHSEVGSKPSLISVQHLSVESKLRQSASEMRVLGRTFPFLVGDLVPAGDANYECFLLLLKIMDLSLSPAIHTDNVAYLRTLIDEHHIAFKKLYPNSSIIPKMHYMIHYPQQILRCGPLVRAWTMRHEAKLNFFKQAAKISNFKNIPKTLAERNQAWFCYQLQSNALFQRQLECGPSTTCILQNEANDTQRLLKEQGINDDGSTICHARWVSVDGIRYSTNNTFVVVGVKNSKPVFGQVIDILICHTDITFLKFVVYNTVFFDVHFHSYAVLPTSCLSVLPVPSLIDPFVLHSRRVPSISEYHYITLKHHLEL